MDLNVVVPDELMDKEGHYLYLISSTLNDRVYVGITSKLSKRIYEHSYHMRQGATNYRSRLYSTTKKHGLNKFTFSLVTVCDNREDLNKAEVDLIAKYKAEGVPLYNLTNGGEGNVGWIPSAETRAKWSETRKGMHTGDNHPMYGKNHTDETKAKIRESIRGENNPMYGRTGDKNHNYGKTGENSPSYKYDPVLIATFPNQKAATEGTGISRSHYAKVKKANPHLFNK
jgi:group I intron endonuclease